MADATLDNNSLTAALAGDATTVGTAFIGEQAAVAAFKANPASVTTLIYVAGAIAALVVIVYVVKSSKKK